MKTLLLTFFSLCFAIGVATIAQEHTSPSPPKDQTARTQPTSMMGTVRAVGEKLTFVTDLRAWNVCNPEILRGHEGHYLRVNGYVYPDKGSIQITEVKMPTASESRKNDSR